METRLNEIKKVAKTLLELPIKIDDNFGIVHHPLIANAFYQDDKGILKKIETKEDEEYIRNDLKSKINNMKDYNSFLHLVNKPYLPIFFKYTNIYLSEKDFSEFLKDMWTCIEFPNHDANVSKKEWLNYFRKANKKLLMSKEELKVYNNLPNKVEIYRGVDNNNNVEGLSWTLDIEKAKWFSNRFGNGNVHKIIIDKKYILAYFNNRNESEVVVDYTKIYFTTNETKKFMKQIDIVDIISHYIILTKKGNNYFGLCPFHKDNCPSFSVSKEKQVYKCFVCGEQGNVIGFIMEYEKVDFEEALTILNSFYKKV